MAARGSQRIQRLGVAVEIVPEVVMYSIPMVKSAGEIHVKILVATGNWRDIYIPQGWAWLDRRGHIRHFTLPIGGASSSTAWAIPNRTDFHLLPRNTVAGKVLSVFRDWILPAGLSVAANRAGSTLLTYQPNGKPDPVMGKIASNALAESNIVARVQSLFDDASLLGCAYFTGDGALVFEKPAPILVELTPDQREYFKRNHAWL